METKDFLVLPVADKSICEPINKVTVVLPGDWGIKCKLANYLSLKHTIHVYGVISLFLKIFRDI